MTRFPRRPLSALALLGAAVVSATVAATAEAGLLRRSGSTVQQDSFNDTRLLVDGLVVEGGAIMTGGTVVSSYSLNSLFPGIYATPADDCWRVVSPSPGTLGQRTACDYEFEKGEELELSGFIDKYLDGAIYDIEWQIGRQGEAAPTWTFSDGIVLTEVEQDEICFEGRNGIECRTPEPPANERRVLLNVPMPVDMGVGDYWIVLAFEAFAPEGMSFFQFSNITNPIAGVDFPCPQVDGPPNPVRFACGQTGFAGDRYALSTSYSGADRTLRVTAPPAEVPLPGTLPLLGLALAGLGLARRRR